MLLWALETWTSPHFCTLSFGFPSQGLLEVVWVRCELEKPWLLYGAQEKEAGPDISCPGQELTGERGKQPEMP